MMPAGRPQFAYDPEIADEICERIATSDDGLEQVIDEMKLTLGDRVPSVRTVYKWLERNEEFAQKSARARKFQAQILHDRAQVQAKTPLIGIVRKVERDGDKETITETTSDNVQRSQLLVQTTLKRAGQLDAKKYGEKVQTEHSGEVGIKTIIVPTSVKADDERPARKPEFAEE